MKASVQSISSSPCCGERERSRFSSCAAAISASLLALLGVEQRIEQALAHAERREHHVARLGLADDVLEHQRGIRQQRTAGRVHHLDLRQRFRIDPPHQAGEFQRLLGADDVAVHDVQRIAGLRHVQLRQRAPGAADRVEGAALAALQQLDVVERVLDDLLGLLDRAAGAVLQGEAAERQRDAGLDAAAVDVDQFERAAAEIADDAVRPVEAGDHAERRQFGLALAGDHVDLGAADAARPRR